MIGTNGIGKQCLLQLAKHQPTHLYFTGRNQKSAEEIISAIQTISAAIPTTFLECDLGARESIKKAFQSGFVSDRLDIVIASAGLMAVPAALTPDGYEIQFGTNHMGHAALMKLCLPIMLRTAEQPGSDVRFICLTSQGYAGHPSGGIKFDTLRTVQDGWGSGMWLGSWTRYGQSKLANIFYAREMGRRYPKILSLPIHPGVVKTGLVTTLPLWKKSTVYITNPRGLLEPGEGAYNTLWAATAPREWDDGKHGRQEIRQGQYYEPVGVAKPGIRLFNDDGTLAKRLWEWTEEQLKDFEV
jgi:NAD(P)-dependent dehydrogenase (short-subunit alcohol dehydrogenase family)